MFSSITSDKKTYPNMRISLLLAFTFFVTAENMFAPPAIDMDEQSMDDILSPYFGGYYGKSYSPGEVISF